MALAAFVLLSAGCGGAGSSTTTGVPAVSSASGSPSASQTRQTGVATITIPARPDAAANGRLIPDYAHYIKVEFLDSNSGQAVPVPVPLYNRGGQQYPLDQETTGKTEATSTPFDVISIDRSIPTKRSYYFLPVKNLVIRVSAYKTDPKKDASGNNPAVAFAEVPYLPKAAALGEPTPEETTVLTLQSAITSLEVTGADALHTGGASTSTYTVFTVLAKSDNAVVLLSDADYAKFTWKTPEVVSGSPTLDIPTTSPPVDFPPNIPPQGAVSGLSSQSRRLVAKGNQSGTVKLTVSTVTDDKGSVVTGTKIVSVDALPGAVQMTVPTPPPGTHSYLVQIDDQVGVGINNSNQDNLPNPVQIIQNLIGTTANPLDLKTTEKNAPVPAGVRRVWVRYYSGANATGVLLGDFIRPGEYFVPGTFASNAPTTITTSAQKVYPTPLVIKVVRGTYYTGNGTGFLTQITKPTVIADGGGPKSDFAFLGGTGDALLEVAAQVPVSGTNTPPERLPDGTLPPPAGVLETILDTDIFTLKLPGGTITQSPSSSGTQTYQVVLSDFSSDNTVGLVLTENAGLNPAPQNFTVSLQANKGGSIGSITIK